MIVRSSHLGFVTLMALGLSCLTGCEDDPPPPPPPPPARPAGEPSAPGGPNARPGQANRRAPQETPPPPMQITDTTFNEDARRVRDPFRSFFRDIVRIDSPNIVQARDVKLERYSLDDLRLVAVVIGTDSPYAMVVDPSRTGTILRRGMYVGRRETVQSPQGGYQVHWRVARITPARLRRLNDGQFDEQPAEIVFERGNPLDTNAQVVERAITLASGVAGAQQQQAPAIGPIPGLSGPTPSYLPSNLGGVGGGSATGAILGTQSAVQQSVGGGSSAPPPPQQTTVVVQVPPQQPTVQPAPPTNAPPPVQIYNGNQQR